MPRGCPHPRWHMMSLERGRGEVTAQSFILWTDTFIANAPDNLYMASGYPLSTESNTLIHRALHDRRAGVPYCSAQHDAAYIYIIHAVSEHIMYLSIKYTC